MRINFLGGPSSSKSTSAAWLFSELKIRHYSVEHVQEIIKPWSYIGRVPKIYDQIYLFGSQQQSEYQYLSRAVRNIVTDSPTLLSCLYTMMLFPESSVGHHLEQINTEYEKDYPSLNFFLNRKDKPYQQEGRYQNYEEAKEVDTFIKSYLDKSKIKYFEFDFSDRDGILKLTLDHIDE